MSKKLNIIKRCTTCTATNDNDLTAYGIIKLHRQRGETSENKIKELKNRLYTKVPIFYYSNKF